MNLFINVFVFALCCQTVFAMQVPETTEQFEQDLFEQLFEQERIEAARKTQRVIDRLLKSDAASEVENELAAITDEYDALEIAATLLLNKKHQTEAALEIVRRSRGAGTFTQDITVDFNSEIKRLVIPKLLQRVQGSDPDLTKRAKSYLQTLPSIPTEYGPELRRMTGHTDRSVREFSCGLMSKLDTVSQKDIDAMILCLQDKDDTVCRSAIKTAQCWGNPKLLPTVRAQQDSRNDTVRIAVARALAILDSTKIQESLAILRDVYFTSKDQKTKDLVADRLIELAPEILNAPDLLLDILGQPSRTSITYMYSYESSKYLEASSTLLACGQAAVPCITRWLEHRSLSKLVQQRLLSVLANSDWDLSSSVPVISELLESQDIQVREKALLALAKGGNVDADFVERKLSDDRSIQRAAAHAFAASSNATRATARSGLLRMMDHKDPAIRVVAIQNYLKLTGDDQTAGTRFVQMIRGINVEGFHSIEFEDQRCCVEVAQALRPTPPGLAAALLKVTVTEYPPWAVFQMMAALDDTAFHVRVQLLDSETPETQAEALRMLGNSRSPQAQEILRRYLTDETEHRVAVSDHFGFSSQLRVTALEALVDCSLRDESLIPILTRGLSEDWSREISIRALGELGPKAQSALPELYSLIETAGDYSLSRQLSRTIALVESDPMKRLAGIRNHLDGLASAERCCYTDNLLFNSLHELLIGLHDAGIDIRPLRQNLLQLASRHPCVARSTRISATCVLAVLEPDVPRWVQMLQSWAAAEPAFQTPASDCLELLERRKSVR